MPSRISIMTMMLGDCLAEKRLSDGGMLRLIEEMGYDGVELDSSRLMQRPDLVKEYASCLGASLLDVTCVDGICNLIADSRRQRAAAADVLRSAVDLAHSFGAPFMLAAGSVLSGDITPSDGRSMIADGLNECTAHATDAGVTLAIENFGVAPTLQCSAGDCLEVLDAVQGLAFVFDTGNFHFCGEDALECLDRLIDRTCYVHLKDWIKSDEPVMADVAGVALGKGFIPNAEIVRRLLDEGQVETFSVEITAPGDPIESARRDLEAVRRWVC